MTEREAQVCDIIRQTLRQPGLTITADQPLDTLGLESIDMVEMLFLIEEQFGIDIPYNANAEKEAALQFATVADVGRAIDNLLVGRAAA